MNSFNNKKKAVFENDKIATSMYRPFCKQYLYYGEKMIHRRGQMNDIFCKDNLAIVTTGINVTKDFSLQMVNGFVDSELNAHCECFPLYYYTQQAQGSLLNLDGESEFERHDGVSDWILNQAHERYENKAITKEDIFYYVYGFLHCPNYRETFANDLRKSLPKIPLVEKADDFWAFSKAGRELAELHLNYETVQPLECVTVKESGNYDVTKMRFTKKGEVSTIIYNDSVSIDNIPEKAYNYIVNGKSAIEWIMERYQVKTDKDSGIVNDPNDWCKEKGKPRYILNLLLSVIAVSVKTVDIVEKLPKVEF
jgi:predicted helicase